jgi:ribosomal protein S18 acetylase RimI-like enzyme
VTFFTRLGSPSDAAEIARVHKLSRRAYYEYGGIAAPEYPDDRVTWWDAQLTAPTRTISVAVRDGEIVGVMLAGSEALPSNECELEGLYVLPSACGAGIGSALHEIFIANLRRARIEHGSLEVWSGNVRAIRFYERHGWRMTREIRVSNGDLVFRRMRIST